MSFSVTQGRTACYYLSPYLVFSLGNHSKLLHYLPFSIAIRVSLSGLNVLHSLFNFPTYLGLLITIPIRTTITLFCLTISANLRDLLLLCYYTSFLDPGIFLFLNLVMFFLSLSQSDLFLADKITLIKVIKK